MTNATIPAPSETATAGQLELRNVSKRFGDVEAVADVSLRLAPGEFLTLLGASGSGKTTTLKIVGGFVPLDVGEVCIDDRAITRLPPHRRDIGMVFQNYALFPHMTAAENVAFPLRARGVPRAERTARVRQALATVRLEGMDDRRPSQMSGGQQQRVALARAIVFEPRLLLMDEPMGALDKQLREALQLELMRIHRELGVSVLYVTHDQEEALVMSDRIAIYRGGHVCQIGTAEDLYERPSSVFVAQFVGESNVFRGVCDRSGGTPRIVGEGCALLVPDADGLADGAAAALVVRPERMRVTRGVPGDAPPADNALAGTVRDIIYLGSGRKYLVELHDGSVRQVRTTVVASDDAGIERGEPVVLSWCHEDAVLLPDAP